VTICGLVQGGKRLALLELSCAISPHEVKAGVMCGGGLKLCGVLLHIFVISAMESLDCASLMNFLA